MLFGFIRFFVVLFVLIFVFFVLRKTNIIKNKRIATLIYAACLIFGIILSVLPIENLFITFKTPQDVFWYKCVGEIEGIIQGEDSCIIFYSKGKSSYSHEIMLKSEKGYKLPSLLFTNTVSKSHDENGIIEIYNVSNTNDYYILGVATSMDGEIYFDCENNEEARKNVKRVDNTYFYYSYFQMPSEL